MSNRSPKKTKRIKGEYMKKIYSLDDLDCAVCAQKMEEAIKKIDGVKDANVSFIMKKLSVEFSEGADEKSVLKTIVKTCRKIEPDCSIIL